MISYALQSPVLRGREDACAHLSVLGGDVAAFSDHAGFLSNKLTFLLDATLGLINIEQSNIVRIFSVAAVVFLPATLIASIYGMNFDLMPELRWPFGYPLVLLLMKLSSWLPYRYFKHRKWL
jgi:magnesium transporter